MHIMYHIFWSIKTEVIKEPCSYGMVHLQQL